MRTKILLVAAALLMFISCGVSSRTDKSGENILKRVLPGQLYVMTEYDRTRYSSIKDFVESRCTVSVKDSGGGLSGIYLVDGTQFWKDVPLEIIYSLKVVNATYGVSYGMDVPNKFVEIETISHFENRTSLERLQSSH